MPSAARCSRARAPGSASSIAPKLASEPSSNATVWPFGLAASASIATRSRDQTSHTQAWMV